MDKKKLLIVGLVIVLVLFGLALRRFSDDILTPSTSTSKFATSTTQTASNRISSTQPIPENIWGQYDINEPNAIMLIDSQGRRTGKDPLTGMIYREIPNTSYGIDESKPGHPVGELTLSNLPSGQYTLYVLGGVTGPYGLYVANNNTNQSFEGNIQKGEMISYVQNFNPNNLTSSTFSVSSTVSSTASITTAPPNNLPPPPVP